ncbi:hypothetical protein HanIR_Chr16g0823991 [Helianthus annuus]|nr:hypothetical protein HanIR_Chr16g0823991 [Helianthus annuus]
MISSSSRITKWFNKISNNGFIYLATVFFFFNNKKVNEVKLKPLNKRIKQCS